MERKLLLWLAVGVVILVGVILTQGFFYSKTAPGSGPPQESQSTLEQERERFLNRLWEAYEKTRENFYQPDRLDPEKLLQEAIRGMIQGLDDPFSRFNTPEEYERFSTPLQGVYEGIGAYIGVRGGEVTIISPIRGGPAERMGVRAGDVVLEIDGESTQGFSDDAAAQRLRGPKGTQVKIKVRHSDGSVEEITITRERIEIPSVEYKLLTPSIAYIRINSFSDTLLRQLSKALEELQKGSRSIEGLVLDLRGNGGGYLHVAKQVGSLFVDRDRTLLIERNRRGEVIDRSSGNRLDNWPIAVLVDQGTASAAEILAGAIRDNDMGVLIGRRTFGKGVIQSTFELEDGSRLILTTAEYLTPDGHRVQDVGLTPDIAVEDWYAALQDVRRQLRGLEQALPSFAASTRAVLQQLSQLLDRVEEQANQDEYEVALQAVGEFRARLKSDPRQLLQEAGAGEDDPELVLIPPLIEKLVEQTEPLLAQLMARMERNDIATAVEWLQSPSIKGQLCPCQITLPSMGK